MFVAQIAANCHPNLLLAIPMHLAKEWQSLFLYKQ
jgi:hypothetical protein